MNDFLCFDYSSRAVRIAIIDGAPWWLAGDLCAVLGLNNVSQALTRLDDDQVRLIQNEAWRVNGPVNMVSESGMWTLVLRSDKAEAVAVRRWLTGEVLPALRQHGTYTMPGVEPPPTPAAPAAPAFDPAYLGAAVAVVREARRLFGTRAARTIWAAVGLPDPDQFAAAPIEHSFPDGLVAALLAWVEGKDRLTYADIGHGIGIGTPDSPAKHRIADILTARGWSWRNTKFGQAQRWTWRAPAAPALAGEAIQ